MRQLTVVSWRARKLWQWARRWSWQHPVTARVPVTAYWLVSRSGRTSAYPVRMTTLQVRGTATEDVDPDRVTVHCSAIARASVAAEAREAAATTAEAMRSALDGVAGLRSLRLSRVSVGEITRWDESTQTTVNNGWQAIVSGQAEADADSAATIAVALIDAGAQVGHLEWSLDPDNPAQRRVRRAAVDDARRAASDFAEAVGQPLGELITLADSGLLDASPRMMSTMAMSDGGEQAKSAVAIDPEPVTVTATVEASFAVA